MSSNVNEFSSEGNSSQVSNEYNLALSSSNTQSHATSRNSHIISNANPVTSDTQRQSTNTNRAKPVLNLNTPNEYLKRAEYASEETLEVNLDSISSGNPLTWKYEIVVAQQPVRACMCGFGDKDRRPISPAPVIQLIVKDGQGKIKHPNEINCSLFVVHTSLLKENGIDEAMIITHLSSKSYPANSKQSLTNNLLGNHVASPYTLNDINGVPGIYFMFPDLSVRTDGLFKLSFSLIDVGIITNFPPTSNNLRKIINTGSSASDILASVTSNRFEVFPAKKFPGMLESTALMRCFANQGIKVPVRNNILKKRDMQASQSEEPSSD